MPEMHIPTYCVAKIQTNRIIDELSKRNYLRNTVHRQESKLREERTKNSIQTKKPYDYHMTLLAKVHLILEKKKIM